MARTPPNHIITTKPAGWTDETWAEYQRENPAPTPQGDSFDPTSGPITLDNSLTGPQSLSERAGVERDATLNVTAGSEAAAWDHRARRDRANSAHGQDINNERNSHEFKTELEDLEAEQKYAKQDEAARVEQELRSQGLPQRAVPGPRSIDGAPTTQGDAFTGAEDAAGYQTRPTGPDGKIGKSKKDIDMAARGFYPVYDPQGNVSYQRGTGATSVGDDSGVPRGAPGRAGLRPDLTMPNGGQPGLPGQPQKAAKYYEDTRSGPLGNQVVLRPTPAFRSEVAARDEERQIGRQAQASGQTRAQIRGLDAVGRREAVADAKGADLAARTKRYKDQMMLAGNNPQKNLVNAVGMLTPGMRDVVLANLTTGGGQHAVDGATPNDIQALNAQAALKLAANRALQGQDEQLPLNPIQQAQHMGNALKARDDMIRQNNGGSWTPGGAITPALHAQMTRDLDMIYPGQGASLMRGVRTHGPVPAPLQPSAGVQDSGAGGSLN